MNSRLTIALLTLSAVAPGALAQLKVSPTAKYAWTENCGYLNLRDAGSPAGAQGVRVYSNYLTGFAWGENIGWVNLGSGSGPYANTNNTNFGVNYNSGTGALTGMAWGENVGWINFSGGAMAAPANPARIDMGALRFRGYAWGENIGWVNLDDATKFVGIACPADVDNGSGTGIPDGGVDINDLLFFLGAFEAGSSPADLDNGSGNGIPDGGVDINDLLYFLSHFEAGC
jgi:hypothetical protein